MIHRQEVAVGEQFAAPRNITFGWQSERNAFSVWYVAADADDCKYVVMPTGSMVLVDEELVASAILHDGFHVFHLCRLKVAGPPIATPQP